MREIKFRAWDTDLKAWMNETDVYNEIQEQARWNPERGERFKLMQYTGIKDKDGKELDWWEGDILRSDHFVDNRGKMHYLYHAIKWSKKYASWMAVNVGSKNEDDHNGSIQLWVFLKAALNPAKVGNIHDNPKLLQMKGE